MEPRLTPSQYGCDLAGWPLDLPIVPVNPTLAIALFMTIDGGVLLGEHIGREMAKRLAPSKPDIIVSAATLGIPVAIEASRGLGLDRYVIAQKSPKVHLGDALVEPVVSITSKGQQNLLLDRNAIPLLAGKRVAVVDDVVATGSSLKALCNLVRKASGEVVSIGVVLTEAHDWRAVLGEDADLLVSLGHIPQFEIRGDEVSVIPETLAHPVPA
ncbi:adenine phosphoribosyltransferase [Faunimonas pinastri]|uniref:Adenine phosphoribosyltransferase n=1 Tax=Faunimonas pinastri TaxID=1855383 RepID=A0A1H9NV42_9HYPH|nr:phosphoribosyltransferase family protein [Faunimonas pinastri]SER39792.1 adenine phosphoribosyltransferase [Faunimonas pinastri]